jgi:hypothetical protein
MSVTPTHAVMPGIPSAPSSALAGTPSGTVARCTRPGSTIACSRQPSWWTTSVPASSPESTSPTAPPCITLPSS